MMLLGEKEYIEYPPVVLPEQQYVGLPPEILREQKEHIGLPSAAGPLRLP